ncbi:MAG: hypothetical protein JWO37_3072 [Acidimicrobiales bacterium]|jgi:uncharacterized protein YecE (DUF72 family)|nr:hypothetical protein [Acidimicrobiales bacterium]
MTGVRVGTSGWSYREWVDAFYPPGTGPGRMLPYYAERLPTVEAHATYRRRPNETTLAGWIGASPDGFRFAPKAHVGITHRRDLTGIEERVSEFCQALAPLAERDRLGPILFQLPHQQPDVERLDRIVAALPDGIDAAFELAPAWLTDAVLQRLDVAGPTFVLTDSDDRAAPDVMVGRLTYVRLRRARYADEELDRWAARLQSMAQSGRDVYAYVKHDEAGRAPVYAQRIQQGLAA